AADGQMQAPSVDVVCISGNLGNVERMMEEHVDDGRAELDAAGSGSHSRQQREGRRKLAGEMMNAKIGAVRTERFGGDCEVDGLQQRIPGRPRLRLRRG